MSKKLGIGIVGLHNWYHSYPFALSTKYIPDTDVVAASHDNPTQLKQFAEEFGIKETSIDMENIIRNKNVDVVIVTAYTSAHLDIVRACCEEGKPVLVDKPLEVSLNKAREMVSCVEKSGVRFMIGHDFIHMPSYIKIKQFIQDGSIGDVVSFSYLVNAPIPKDWIGSEEPGWYADPFRAGYGGFIDHAVHQFDLLRFVLKKEGKRVFGTIGNLVHKNLKVDDYGSALVEFESGIRGVVESTWLVVPPSQFNDYLSIRGTSGSLLLAKSENPGDIVLNGRILTDVYGKVELVTDPEKLDWFRPVPGVMEYSIDVWYVMLKKFIESIREDKEPPQTIYDGLKSLELSIAVYESSKRKKPISIDEL